MPNEAQVLEALRPVEDPEIHRSIVELNMVRGIEIEGGNDPGVDVQYPWEAVGRRFHRHRVHVASFYIDRAPVTNAEFKTFVDATRYHLKDDHNFLRDWKDGSYPEGWDKKPVTWVSIEDARAYAAWAGKRLKI